MSDKIAIKVENVSKNFKLPHERHSSVKNALVNVFKKRKSYELQKALRKISFEVQEGEFFGIVGRNGSGKSTLLKLLAGIYSPTKGSITINGKLTPFIELGVGFNPELTGRENVFLNGALLGFSRKDMSLIYDDIVKFAELERFMDQKLKNYSSGMQVRLAFSIAIRAKSDILLIDEVLAVGDAAFQQKCYDYFHNLKQNKQTVVFVSHDRGAIENFCDRCILINDGEIIASGEPTNVLNKYNEITLNQISSVSKANTKKAMTGEGGERENRWGNGDIEIIEAKLLKGKNKYSPGETIEFKVHMKAHKSINEPVFGIVIKRSDGSIVLTTNTKLKKMRTGKMVKTQDAWATYTIKNIFGNGKYTISPAVASEDTKIFYDWREGILEFFVSGWDDAFTAIHPPHEIGIKKR